MTKTLRSKFISAELSLIDQHELLSISSVVAVAVSVAVAMSVAMSVSVPADMDTIRVEKFYIFLL